MYCKKCGAENSSDAVFCNQCGESLINDTKNDVDTKDNNLSSEEKNEDCSVPENKKIKRSKIIIFSLLIVFVCSIVICYGKLTDFTFSYSHYKIKKYNTKDGNGNTCLMRDILDKNDTEAKKLIDLGVDLKARNKEGNSALLLAVKMNNKDVVKFLAEKKTELNCQDNQGNTAILVAIQNNNMEICKVLISAGADIYTRNKLGESALHLSVKKDNTQLIDLLCSSKGVNLDYKDNNGDNPLLYAIKLKKLDIAQMLLKYKANPNSTDNNGANSFDIAFQENEPNMLKLLISSGQDDHIQLLMQEQELTGSGSYTPVEKDFIVKNNNIYDFYFGNGVQTIFDASGAKRYEGQIQNGKINGYGTVFSGGGKSMNKPGQILYKGYWKDGLWNGVGQSYWILSSNDSLNFPGMKNTVFYDTTYQNGYRNGSYMRYYSDGSFNDKGTDYESADGSVQTSSKVLPKKNPSIGMTADQVLNSSWGKPQKVNTTVTEYGTSEQWVYNGYRYIYIDNGIVTGIQY